MRFLAVLIALALVGCVTEPRDYYVGDMRFTPSQRTEIERANAWLATRTGVPAVEIRWAELPTTGRERTIVLTDLPAGFSGDAATDGSIRIDPSQGGDRIGPVFAHELCHVLGLAHHTGRGLMNRNAPPGLVWTPDDIEDCGAHGVCR